MDIINCLRMEIIKERNELASLEQRFAERLMSISDGKFKTIVGYLGEHYEMEVYYSKKLRIWFYFGTDSNRYWNIFGIIEEPTPHVSIVVEINIPFEGRNNRIAGVFVKDDDGKIWLGHNGKIGGGRHGIGLKAFWEEYGGERVEVQDNGKTFTFARIGYIESENFPEKVRDFVFEVNEIKERRKLTKSL